MNNRLLSVALSLLVSGACALPVVAADIVASEPVKVADVSNNPDDYGYAGIAFDPQEDGTLIVESLLPGSPAASSELKPKDKIISFKIKEKSSDVYKQLNRTISFNPHKTLQLKVIREEANNKVLNISLKIGSYKDNPDPVRFAHAMESRRLFAKAIPFTPKLQKLIGRTPNIIEIYSPDRGPSRVLMSARVLGVKAVSAAIDSVAANKLGESGMRVDKPDVYLVTPDGLLYPYLLPQSEFEALKVAKEFGCFELPPIPLQINRIALSQKSDKWIAPEEHHAGNMMAIFDQRGGHFSSGFSYMHQIVGTWPESDSKWLSKDIEQIKSAAKAVINAIQNDTLDLKSGQALCTGEALNYGNSVKAHKISRPAFASFGALDGQSIQVNMVSGETAVARVHELSAPFNVYMYFAKARGSGWRLSAIRTPVDLDSIDLFSAKKRASADDHQSEWLKSHPIAAATIDQFNAISSELSSAEDSKLVDWFVAHKDDLNGLAKQGLEQLQPNVIVYHDALYHRGLKLDDADGKQMIEGDEIKAKLGRLGLSMALKPRDKNVFLGLDASNLSDTGFLYSVDNLPPPINPYGCYWWQKLDDHWYLVRAISGYFPRKLR